MDDDTASRFVSSLVKSIQALCNGYIDFSSSIEVVGHIHLNIDRNVKLDYVLTEEVSKSLSEGSTVFASHSYHSKPLSNLSKSSGDHSNRNKKSQQNNDTDPLGIGSLPPEVPNATRSESHSRTANRVCDSGDSSLSGSQDFDSVKQENRSSCQVRDSFEKRRRSGPGRRSPSPVAKRGRSNDTNSGVDVIEIKEEPDDEPSVFFGNSAGGADIQTPDFSNVVMESLDRVGQAEGASLVAGDVMQMNKQQPFPVMLHSNMPSTSSSVTGQSDPRASTSGAHETEGTFWHLKSSLELAALHNQDPNLYTVRNRTVARQEDEDLEQKIKQGLPFRRTPRQLTKLQEMQAAAHLLGNSVALNEFTIQCGRCSKYLQVPSDRTPAKRVKYFQRRHYDNSCKMKNTFASSGQTSAEDGPSYTD